MENITPSCHSDVTYHPCQFGQFHEFHFQILKNDNLRLFVLRSTESKVYQSFIIDENHTVSLNGHALGNEACYAMF